MKKGFVLVGLALMTWSMAGSALAGPFNRFPRAPHPQRAIPQDEMRELENNNREKDHAERGGEKNTPVPGPNAAPPPPSPSHGGFGEVGQSGNLGPQQGGRAGGRMSVEERQKLRRQINEAGRSLYTPPAANK